MSGFQRLRDIDGVTGLERRPRTVKACPKPGCDWFLVTSWFIGGPGRVEEVSALEQEMRAGRHMQVHYPPERKTFI